jgi:hypothetical protein
MLWRVLKLTGIAMHNIAIPEEAYAPERINVLLVTSHPREPWIEWFGRREEV